jgi:hypothetical protein
MYYQPTGILFVDLVIDGRNGRTGPAGGFPSLMLGANPASATKKPAGQ